MKIKQLSLVDIEFIAHRIAVEMMDYDEPIPQFSTRFPGKLESCLQQPFQYFSNKPLYRFIYQRAAILFYLIIKNHPFANGNKRLAITITLVFLHRNNKWLDVAPKDLYKIACDIAESKPSEMDVNVNSLKIFFKKYITNL